MRLAGDQLDVQAEAAARNLRWLAAAVVGTAALAALLVAAGLWIRLREYR
jgi:hypothetical protein